MVAINLPFHLLQRPAILLQNLFADMPIHERPLVILRFNLILQHFFKINYRLNMLIKGRTSAD